MDGGRLPCGLRGAAAVRRAAAILAHPVTGAVCRLLLGGIFVYTAVPKLTHPAEFARLVYGYRILDPSLVNLAAITLPWIEVTAGSFLALGVLPRSSAAVVAGLLALFMAAGALALARGLKIECGCFFPLLTGDRLTWRLLARDGALFAIALQPIVWPTSFLGGRRGPRTGRDPGGNDE